MSLWSQKWALKLDLLPFLSMIELINRTLFEQAKSKFRKQNSEDFNGTKNSYFRFYELEQDIASLTGILVFIKLNDGLSDYPYLLLAQPEELKRMYNC